MTTISSHPSAHAVPLTLDVMCAVLEVWQAILVKKLDLDSSWVKQSMSEGARQLLKVWVKP